MTKLINPAVLGALVRERREAAGLTQTQLAERIGASRFWVAAFEKGKPSAELGLALKAIQALGLSIQIEPEKDTPPKKASSPRHVPSSNLSGHVTLANVIARATRSRPAPSQVTGWPGAEPPERRKQSND